MACEKFGRVPGALHNSLVWSRGGSPCRGPGAKATTNVGIFACLAKNKSQVLMQNTDNFPINIVKKLMKNLKMTRVATL